MQLDNPAATEKQLWDWKSNLDAGKQLYAKKKNLAVNFLDTHPDSVTTEMELKCAFQKYNGGVDPETGSAIFYWKWDEKNGWIKDDRITNGYGDAVWVIYETLK